MTLPDRPRKIASIRGRDEVGNGVSYSHCNDMQDRIREEGRPVPCHYPNNSSLFTRHENSFRKLIHCPECSSTPCRCGMIYVQEIQGKIESDGNARTQFMQRMTHWRDPFTRNNYQKNSEPPEGSPLQQGAVRPILAQDLNNNRDDDNNKEEI